jgi:hypothetical protein
MPEPTPTSINQRAALRLRLEGDQSVLVALFRKARLVESGDPKHAEIRFAVLFCGGGQSSVEGAGASIALKRAGVLNAITTAIGISGGAADVLYMAAGHPEKDPYMWMAAAANPLVSPMRVILRRGPLVDVDDLMRRAINTRDQRFSFDERGFQNTPIGEIYFVAADYDQGVPVFLNAKLESSALAAAFASLKVPAAHIQFVEHTDHTGKRRRLTDGGCVAPPIAAICSKFAPTHLLIIPNRMREKKLTLSMKIIMMIVDRAIAKKMPIALRRQFEDRDRLFLQTLDAAIDHSQPLSTKTLIAWPSDVVDQWSADLNGTRQAARDSLRAFTAALQEAREAEDLQHQNELAAAKRHLTL